MYNIWEYLATDCTVKGRGSQLPADPDLAVPTPIAARKQRGLILCSWEVGALTSPYSAPMLQILFQSNLSNNHIPSVPSTCTRHLPHVLHISCNRITWSPLLRSPGSPEQLLRRWKTHPTSANLVARVKNSFFFEWLHMYSTLDMHEPHAQLSEIFPSVELSYVCKQPFPLPQCLVPDYFRLLGLNYCGIEI